MTLPHRVIFYPKSALKSSLKLSSSALLKVSCVDNIYRLCERSIRTRRCDASLDDRISNGCWRRVVSHNKGNINGESKVLLNCTSEVCGCISSDCTLVTNCGVVMRTNREVDVRQSDNIPLMEISLCATECLSVNSCQHTHITVCNCIESSIVATCICKVGGEMEHLAITRESVPALPMM